MVGALFPVLVQKIYHTSAYSVNEKPREPWMKYRLHSKKLPYIERDAGIDWQELHPGHSLPCDQLQSKN
jgi:hypothetical protein